ncbi:MAG: hypothetical protein HQ477_01740, partial [Chloroflexi bacterium]|nr:hypothetical protein [Chloroflexota bacterium]
MSRKLPKLLSVLGALVALAAFSTVALAMTTTGAVTVSGSPVPTNLTNGAVENANIQIFSESTGVVLASPMIVGTTTIPAGRYNSFIVHFDPTGSDGTASGTVDFDSNISFVLKSTDELTGTDSTFGTGATYQVTARQAESGDTATAVNRTLTLDMKVTGGNIDEIRVLTMAPRIAGVGGNQGSQAANAIPLDIPGATVTRISTTTYNGMTPDELRAAYDVLIFTWNSASANTDWVTRIEPYIALGGGVIFEDNTNIGQLAPAVYGTGASGSNIKLSTIYAGLTDGILDDFVNNHIKFTSWLPDFTPFIQADISGITEVVGLYGGSDIGCMVVQGPDMDFHGLRSGSAAAFNQYQMLLNEVKFVTSGCSVADDPNVADTTAPVVTAPADITVEGDTTGGANASNAAIVAFLADASAVDDVDAVVTVTDDGPWFFPLGVATVVTFSSTDAASNTGTATATVTVVDTTAPVVTTPSDITVQADSVGGANASNAAIVAFLAGASAIDAVDSSLTISNNAPGLFPTGVATVVTFSSTDDSVNTGTALATVTVVPVNSPPVIVTITGDEIDENGFASIEVTFSDVDAGDIHTIDIDWGLGQTPDLDVPVSSGTTPFTHQYLDDGTSPGNGTASDGNTVTVTIHDGKSLPAGSVWEYTFTDPTGDANWNTSTGGWTTGPAPFGNDGPGTEFDPGTYWPADAADGDDLWVRTTIDLSGIDLSTVSWGLGVDNGFKLYANGTLVGSGNAGGWTSRWEYTGGFGTALLPGLNVIAVALEDHGGATAFDMEINPSTTGTTTVTVNNVAPVLTISAAGVDENNAVNVSGTITDPGTLDTHVVVIDWGGSEGTSAAAVSGNTFTASHLYLDDDPTGTASDVYTITATATDDDAGVGSVSTDVTVNNVAPTGSIAADAFNSEVTVTFSDVGSLDTHSATVDWGDGLG